MEKLNIAELLKDCPKGMELDCTCADNVVFDKIIEYDQIKCVIGECREPLILDKYGRLLHICCPKCVIFPKGKTTWEGFKRPLKDGDVLITNNNALCIYKSIHKTYKYNNLIDFYCGYRQSDNQFVIKDTYDSHFGSISEAKLATEEEKEKLFKAIKYNGYRWNAETKTLEKMIEPKFKVGDRVLWKYDTETPRRILEVKLTSKGGYVYWINCEGCTSRWWDETELIPIPNKFDITTLKPFESRVLVRNVNSALWKPAIYGFSHSKGCYVVGGGYWEQFIPYEANKELLGTTNNLKGYGSE